MVSRRIVILQMFLQKKKKKEAITEENISSTAFQTFLHISHHKLGEPIAAKSKEWWKSFKFF